MSSRAGLAAALCASLAVLACGTGQDRGVVTLRFWGMGREGEVVQQLVSEFERENPGIRVRVQQIPWTAAHEKLLTAHVGDATPDVAQLGNTWVPEFAALDALRPLDGHVRASAAVKAAGFFPGIWDTNVVDGRVYGIPWYVDTRVLFYRTDLLKQAGYDSMPGDWAGWLEAMRRVKAVVGPGRYAILLPTNEWAQPVVFGMQAGSPLLKDGGRWSALADPTFRKGFDFYVGLFRHGLAPALGQTEISNIFQEFARGFFAMYITGPWNVGEMRSRLPADMQGKWATAPLPGPAGPTSGTSLAGGSSIVIFRHSAHPAEAWKLVEFLARPDVQLRFSRLTGDLPARTEAWRDTSLLGNRYMRPFYDQLQRARPLPKVPEIELIVQKVAEAAERAIRGNAPTDRVLSGLDRDVNQVLEKRRWMLARQAARAGAAAGGGR